MLFEFIEDIPKEHQHLFKKLIKNGIIKQEDDKSINISKDVFDVILILARLGLL